MEKTELCGQALNTFNDVRTLDVYLLLIYGDCEFLYVLNLYEQLTGPNS